MIAPKNGKRSASAVEVPISHGSSMRRRASLLTQYATASQRTAMKKNDRFLITSQRLESKKLVNEATENGARSEFVIRAVCLRSIRFRMQCRELRRQRPVIR